MITTPVLVDGTSVEVTTNLAEALSELRKSRELLVWADALCINQGELYERSYQVQRMGQIYSKARKVISWLGYDGYRSESARVNRDSSGLYKRSGLSVDRNATSHSFLYDNSRLARRLVKSAYWRRIWIIQEVSKASNVEVWCANWTWDLDALLEFFLSRDASLSISDSDRYVLEAIRYIRTRERQSHIAVARMLLSVSLLRSRMSLATDPRDKIYALLSLTLDGNEVVPTPSYRQNVEAIYNDGQGEYRTHLANMDQVAGTYSFNNNINMRLNETTKDSIDPKGILAPRKNGVWPKKYRENIEMWRIPLPN